MMLQRKTLLGCVPRYQIIGFVEKCLGSENEGSGCCCYLVNFCLVVGEVLTALERKLLAERIVRAENRLPVFSVVCEGQILFVPLENLS